MKGYATKNKRLQLNCKYRWRGMAKTNTRKLNKRQKFIDHNGTLDEYTGPAFAPVKTPPVCRL